MNSQNSLVKNDESKDFKSGYISILGAPNAGKSTLINHILGEKLSIISKKPQTTRNRIIGIVNRPNAQMIFIDTPGVHKSNSIFNKRMTEKAFSTIGDADIVALIVDISKPDRDSENILIEKIKLQSRPVILALNKIDLVPHEDIKKIFNEWETLYHFHRIFPISAKHGNGIEMFLNEIENLLPIGTAFFPTNLYTDVPERFIVAEIIREKVFRFTGEEIPYATAVTIESFQEQDRERIIRIHATIHVERDSQKGIIIGKSGAMIKKIGTAARMDIEQLVGVNVFLALHVRVRKNWTKDPKALSEFGY